MAEIQRLRRKFILVGTLAVIIIVVGALGLINTISYMRMQHSVFSLLTSISENGGQLPRREGERPSSWIEDPDWYNDSPESIYQIRYFSIVLDRLGNVEDVNLSRIASFSESEAVQVVRSVIESQRDRGIFRKNRASYSYMVSPLTIINTVLSLWILQRTWQLWKALSGIPCALVLAAFWFMSLS